MKFIKKNNFVKLYFKFNWKSVQRNLNLTKLEKRKYYVPK